MEHIIQKIKRQEIDEWKIAERYYTILSAINSLQLTEREIQLIAYTAIKGNISYREYRDQFCKEHNTSSPTINNIISKLKKIGIFIIIHLHETTFQYHGWLYTIFTSSPWQSRS